MHLCRQYNFWSLRCSWSIACQHCSNYIFILDLTPGFNRFGRDKCKTRRETFKFLDLVHLILDILWYNFNDPVLAMVTTRIGTQVCLCIFALWRFHYTNGYVTIFSIFLILFWLVVALWCHMATQIWSNISSDNGLFPDGTWWYLNQCWQCHLWGSVAWTCKQFELKDSSGWGLGAFLSWWPPSTMWAGPLIFLWPPPGVSE